MPEIKLDPEFSIRGLFPSVSDQQWREGAEKLLRGKPFDSLLTKTYEDLVLQPLYTPATAAAAGLPESGAPDGPPWLRGTTRGWTLLQPYTLGVDVGTLAGQLGRDAARGVEGAWLQVPDRTSARTLPDLPDDPFSGRVDLGSGLDVADRALLDAVAGNERWTGRFDPFAVLVQFGGLPGELNEAADVALSRIADPRFRIAISLVPAERAGADLVTQNAIALAQLAWWLREADTRGIGASALAARIDLLVPIGRDTFREIARLRALRGLWAALLSACGVEDIPAPFIQTVDSGRVWTKRDPWVNMLRSTAQTFAGIAGGANAIATVPFDAAIGEPDELGRRMAINTQLILRLESHLGTVVDPAAGSFYLDQITQELIEASWKRFQEIERDGGLVGGLRQGTLLRGIEAVQERRDWDLATRKAPIIGVSAYPNIDEEPVVRPPEPAAAATVDAFRIEPWPRRRDADAYEALRDLCDEQDPRPSVFLANLGTIAQHNARATFAKNFYESGGLRTIGNDGFPSLDALVAAFRDSGARVACICSSDDVYVEQAADAARALREQGAALVSLAGRPGEHEDAWRSAGIERFIFVGCDVLAELHATLEIYGVSAS